MDNPATTSGDRQIIIHYDDETPGSFVVGLLTAIFGKSRAEARKLVDAIPEGGQGVCAVYPAAIAEALVAKAHEHIRVAGHGLRITLQVPPATSEARCSFCSNGAAEDRPLFQSASAMICRDCIETAANQLPKDSQRETFKYAYQAIDWHFAELEQDEIVTTVRQFPAHMRADLQLAIDTLFSAPAIRFFGIHEQSRYETQNFAALMRDDRYAAKLAAAQFQDVDIGESGPIKCLSNGLWLRQEEELRFAVVLFPHREHGYEGTMCVEIAVPVGEAGAAFVRQCFKTLETAINNARCYRGKVLSFEGETDYRGQTKGLLVHRLPAVGRDAVILPDATLKLLERNVIRFVDAREKLRALGQSTRKGVLLYGPPGTGKTHTIRYLASNLPFHTTLIITAGQMGLLSLYMTLARLLQPALVVIEDVDLIAKSREMQDGCSEPLLNALLNEMDGLKEDADIIFVLTTNRPEQLEAALAGRPGRIDQAIEVPLPDETGRAKLVRLYGGGLDLADEIVEEAVGRTQGVSAAFIKELMRRTAQSSLMRGTSRATSEDIDEALNDMLFSGGRLNVRLLGGAGNEPIAEIEG